MKLKEKVLDMISKRGGVPDVGQETEVVLGEQLIGVGEEEEAAEKEAEKEAKKEERRAKKEAEKGERKVEKGAEKEEKKEVKDYQEGVASKRGNEGAVSGDVGSVGDVPVNNISSGGVSNLEVEKLNGKIEMLDSLIKGVNERLSVIGQQVGEVRSMAMGNEKSIIKSTADSLKAVDIVKEVKPEELRVAYQKMDLKIQMLNEKLGANKEFNDSLMAEIKELKGKAGLFVGTEGVLKLNDDVKKDLIEVQKLASKVRLNADKSEQIFMEIRKGFAESQKLNQIFNGLDSSYSGLREQVEKLKVDYSSLVSYKDYTDNQKRLDSNLAVIEESLNSLDEVKKNNERLTDVVEKVFVLVRNNERNVDNLAVTIGDTKVKKASDYEERFRLLLEIVEEVSDELAKVKKKVGVKGKRGTSKKAILKKKIEESVDNEGVETGVSKKVDKDDSVVSESDATKALEGVEGEGKKKSFLKKLFSLKGESPLEADLKSSEVGKGKTTKGGSDSDKGADGGNEVGKDVDGDSKVDKDMGGGDEVEKTVDGDSGVDKGMGGGDEVEKKVEKAPETIRGEKQIDNIKKKREVTMKGIDEGSESKARKMDDNLKSIQSEIGKLKGSVKSKKNGGRKVGGGSKKQVGVGNVKKKNIKLGSKRGRKNVGARDVKEKVGGESKKKDIRVGGKSEKKDVKGVSKREKRKDAKFGSKKERKKVGEKSTIKKQTLDKRLKALEKARRVHMKNVNRKKKVKSKRLKSLEKARKVHMKNVKLKKKMDLKNVKKGLSKR